MTDIPDRYTRRVIGQGLTFPDNDRYTLQWLVTPPEASLWVFPDNNDATYQDLLTDRPDVPRPLALVPAPMGPGKTANDHLRSIKKRNRVTSKEGRGSRKKRKTFRGARDADSDSVQHSWDEDDVVLFFWGNSKVARERRIREEQERGRHVEEWRDAVTGSPSS